MTPHTPLGPGREFDLVRALVERWGAAAQTIGDDAASVVVPKGERLVASTDVSVERVHFLRDWFTPTEIADRAVTAALSDLAAMAARPLGVLVALVLPDRWMPSLGELADGIANAVRRAETHVMGGDLSTGAELALAITVLGGAPRPVTRSGARAGDRLYATGQLGGPGDALRSLRRGESPGAWSRARFAAPVARLREGLWLAEHGASALIDVSDGLSADLAHLAAASGVLLQVQLERVPVGPGLAVRDAVASGEEYELLCASPHVLNTVAFEERFGVPLHMIGEVLDAAVPAVLATHDGVRVDLAPGHDHFTL